MKQWINRNFFTMAFAAAAGYILLLLMTFDAFCLETVTPEQPLITIAWMKFFRNEFTILLFALTALIGAVLARIFNRRAAVLVPVLVTSLFIFLGFIALFDVDLMQSLDPEMRISHVTMSVSRALSIVAGASGIPAGYLLTVSLERADLPRLMPTAGLVGLAAITALADRLYVPVYLMIAAAIAVLGILCSQADREITGGFEFAKWSDGTPCRVCRMISWLLAGFLFTLSAVCVPNYYMQYLRGSESAVMAAVAFAVLLSLFLFRRRSVTVQAACLSGAAVLALLAIFVEQKFLVLAAAVFVMTAALALVWAARGGLAIALLGSVLGAAAGYCLRHFAGLEVVYSGNRTLYITQPELFIVLASAAAAMLAFVLAEHALLKKEKI